VQIIGEGGGGISAGAVEVFLLLLHASVKPQIKETDGWDKNRFQRSLFSGHESRISEGEHLT